MTLRDLNQLQYLRRELRRIETQIAEIKEGIATPSSSAFDAVGGGGSRNLQPMESRVISALSQEDKYEWRKSALIDMIAILEKYISDISDSRTRQIFELRFEYGYTWAEVAKRMGGGNTAETVRQVCCRYVKLSHMSQKSML